MYKRMTIYFGLLTVLLVLFPGCQTFHEGTREVGEFIGAIDPETVEQTAKEAGRVISYFYPAVGGAVTTLGSAIGWIFERSKKKEYAKAAEGYSKALEQVKNDLKNGGNFQSWDELKRIINMTEASSKEGKKVYRELKQKWSQIEESI